MKYEKISFVSDYMEGAHPKILKRLTETNLVKSVGYGTDEYSESAREKIRTLCAAPNAEVRFLVGGTQTNAVVIDTLLRRYEGVLTTDCGHINTHEAGAIEFCGHKVVTAPHENGKLSAEKISAYMEEFLSDASREHVVPIGMVYISQPTEYGTLYSLAELEEISRTCKKYGIKLYVDGARLLYGLAAKENDVTLPDLARLCDAFYIGGTKCGLLFGEAVVIPDRSLAPSFFTMTKQHGALLAKGRIAGLQFDELFSGDLYKEMGENAIKTATALKDGLSKKGYDFLIDSPTNQIFPIFEKKKLKELEGRVFYTAWESVGESKEAIRLVTSWATDPEEVREFLELI